ncbi:MAG: hypothetical protein H0X62_17685 [Bacteroidetes bacterium]|nr:hypothetical protein [Bacteroidota bacterium]
MCDLNVYTYRNIQTFLRFSNPLRDVINQTNDWNWEDFIVEPDPVFEDAKAALDAHWGAAMTYDYFLNRHGRNSFDNQGGQIRCFINYAEVSNNAFWMDAAYFGNGDGISDNPWVSLDMVAHEIA